MNKVELTGRLTKDIELRYIDATTACTGFTVAVRRKYKNRDGEYDSDFITCKAFKHSAEYLSKYACKGTMIGIEGEIQTGSYEDRDGKRVYTTDVRVDNVEVLFDGKPKTESEPEEVEEVEVEEPKEKLSDDVFSEFGNSIEITDEDLAF